MRGLEVIWGPVWRVIWRVIWRSSEGHLRVISEAIWDPFWTLSEKPHEIHANCLHLAMGRALRLN